MFLGLFTAIALVGSGLWQAANTPLHQASPPGSNEPQQISNNTGNHINVLLLGTDEGDCANPDSPRRSDAIIVASIDPDAKTVNLLSIPRDSRVIIPGHQGYDKIAHAFFYGGPELAVRTVESFLQVPIDHYVVIDWQAFINVVDILGGVDITVEHTMNYNDPYQNLSIHLAKGYQHLDGQKAGEYVRFRHDELGDIGRVERQEKFFIALKNQLLQTGTLLKLPSLVTTLNQYIHTDIDIYTMMKLAMAVKDIPPDGLHTDMVPGAFATIDDLSYWVPDMNKTQTIVHMLTGPKNQYSQAKLP